MAVLLLMGAVDRLSRIAPLAAQDQELTQQADWAQPLAGAVLDRLHVREHEDAGGVQQRLGHVERLRQHPGHQIEHPRDDVGRCEGAGSGKVLMVISCDAKMTPQHQQFDYLRGNGTREIRMVGFPL
jgi:hypothetical protein